MLLQNYRLSKPYYTMPAPTQGTCQPCLRVPHTSMHHVQHYSPPLRLLLSSLLLLPLSLALPSRSLVVPFFFYFTSPQRKSPFWSAFAEFRLPPTSTAHTPYAPRSPLFAFRSPSKSPAPSPHPQGVCTCRCAVFYSARQLSASCPGLSPF